jgi:putative transposase
VIVGLVAEAVSAGAGRDKACATIGLCARTLGRWCARGEGQDGRAQGGVSPVHKLTAAERAEIVTHATSAEYCDLSPRQIVPLLADRGVYVASESSFYRVLHEHGLMSHREPSRPPTHRRPPEHVATAPNTVWSWDITYLRSPVRGVFYYLYLVLDIFSRKVVAFGVHDVESPDLASDLVESACTREGVLRHALVLHADNGGPMKGSTMLATLQRLASWRPSAAPA